MEVEYAMELYREVCQVSNNILLTSIMHTWHPGAKNVLEVGGRGRVRVTLESCQQKIVADLTNLPVQEARLETDLHR